MNTIKKLRQEKELTQSQLAELLKLDQTTISKWELGKALPDSQMLIRLAEFFDVSTDFLLGISKFYYPDQVKATHGNFSYSSNEQALLNNFRKLPDDLQRRASAYMEILVSLTKEEANTTFTQQNSHSSRTAERK